MTRQSITPYRLVAATLFSFAIGILINTLEPAVLGFQVLRLASAQKNTVLGLTTFAGLTLAMLVQPVVGVLSDNTRSRWGRRLPFLAFGTVLVIPALFGVALARAIALVVVSLLVVQVAANIIQGASQALIPDLVPTRQHGLSSGLKSLFEILAFVVGRQVSGQLVARGNLLAAVGAAAGVMLLALLVTATGAREAPPATAPPHKSLRRALAHTYAVDWRNIPAFKGWLANRFFFWAGFIALQTFLLFYIIDVVSMPEPDAIRYVANLSTLIGVAVLLVTLPSGWLADRAGRRPLLLAASGMASAGAAIILLVRDITLIAVGAAMVGLAIGVFLSTSWAMVTDIVPRGEAARYLGIANIASAGGSGVARLLGGALIDPINRLVDSNAAGYLTLYTLATLFFLISAAVVWRVPVHSSQPVLQ